MKTILSVLAAIIIAELFPLFWEISRSNSKAAGIALVWAFLVGSLLSLLFWVLAITLFAIFFSASRAGHVALRVIFFWIPTLTACLVGGVIAFLLTYLTVHFRHS